MKSASKVAGRSWFGFPFRAGLIMLLILAAVSGSVYLLVSANTPKPIRTNYADVPKSTSSPSPTPKPATTPVATSTASARGATGPVAGPVPVPSAPTIFPPVSVQCSTEVQNQDHDLAADYEAATTTANSGVRADLEMTGGQYTSAVIAGINEAYESANTTMTSDYQGYISFFNSFQPGGGSVGECRPDQGPPTLYPVPYTGP